LPGGRDRRKGVEDRGKVLRCAQDDIGGVLERARVEEVLRCAQDDIRLGGMTLTGDDQNQVLGEHEKAPPERRGFRYA